MAIRVTDFTRVVYACDVCERTSPPNDVENGAYAGVPAGWKQFGSGKILRNFCPFCCAKQVPDCPIGFTVGQVIDAAIILENADPKKLRLLGTLLGPFEEAEAC